MGGNYNGDGGKNADDDFYRVADYHNGGYHSGTHGDYDATTNSASDGFDHYVENTIDPGPWLLLITVIFCFAMMLIVVPCAVRYTVQKRRRKTKKGQRQIMTTTTNSPTTSPPLSTPSPIVPITIPKQRQTPPHSSSQSEPTSIIGRVLAKAKSRQTKSTGDQRTATSSLTEPIIIDHHQPVVEAQWLKSSTKTTTPSSPTTAMEKAVVPLTTITPTKTTTTTPMMTPNMISNDDPSLKISIGSIVAFDRESKKILKLAIPHSVGAVAKTSFANLCLILISQKIGTKPVAAYALVQVLAGLTDGVLQGPIYACTATCSQAVGAGNTILAGKFIQLSLLMYGICYVPVIYFWYTYMYEIILWLEWGDVTTAILAQDFIRVYVWAYLLGGISLSLWQLLEITNHAIFGTMIMIFWGLSNVIAIAILTTVIFPNGNGASLVHVAYIYNGTSLLFIIGTIMIAHCKGWLAPFLPGLIGQASFTDPQAVSSLLKQAVPLALGSLLSNAEWAVLTFFASHLGPAEVAAWALLGSLWEVFYASTAGIGDAAEIRLAYHLGHDDPVEAQRCAYKALSLGMLVATVISVLYFCLQSRIPAWFTPDATLQAMLEELVPFVGVANLTMTFGMQCWSLIGAQGKYKLATWISFISSWGVVMPLAALFVFGLRLDLQGLTAASCVGYLSTGSALSYVLLSTDWPKVARKIHKQSCCAAKNDDDNDASTVAGGDSDSGDERDDADNALEDLMGGTGTVRDNQMYAALRHRSDAARRTARRHIKLLVIPAGCRSGLVLGNAQRRNGTYVVKVHKWSPYVKYLLVHIHGVTLQH
jgi:multidrug resistance protein, MATE family